VFTAAHPASPLYAGRGGGVCWRHACAARRATTASPPAAPAFAGRVDLRLYCRLRQRPAGLLAAVRQAFLARMPANPQVHIVAMVDRPGHTGTTLYELGGGKVTRSPRSPRKDSAAALPSVVHPPDSRSLPVYSSWIGVIGPRLTAGATLRGTTSRRTTSPAEMQSAIGGAGVPIDVLSFDACNMADVRRSLSGCRSHKPGLLRQPREVRRCLRGRESRMDGFPLRR